jgi:hypothetical protein
MNKHEQGIPPAPVLLKMSIVQQKSSLGRICLKSARMNLIRNLVGEFNKRVFIRVKQEQI